MSAHIPKIPQGCVLLMCFYHGTPITLQTTKKQYPAMSKKITEGAKRIIDGMLSEGYTKEQIADDIQKQQEDLHNKILSVAKFVSDEILEQAWGADWKHKEVLWAVNIASLLRLKRIKNDDMYGWSLHDHNSVRNSMDGGDVACVFGDEDTQKQLKKVRALMKEMSK